MIMHAFIEINWFYSITSSASKKRFSSLANLMISSIFGLDKTWPVKLYFTFNTLQIKPSIRSDKSSMHEKMIDGYFKQTL